MSKTELQDIREEITGAWKAKSANNAACDILRHIVDALEDLGRRAPAFGPNEVAVSYNPHRIATTAVSVDTATGPVSAPDTMENSDSRQPTIYEMARMEASSIGKEASCFTNEIEAAILRVAILAVREMQRRLKGQAIANTKGYSYDSFVTPKDIRAIAAELLGGKS